MDSIRLLTSKRRSDRIGVEIRQRNTQRVPAIGQIDRHRGQNPAFGCGRRLDGGTEVFRAVVSSDSGPKIESLVGPSAAGCLPSTGLYGAFRQTV